MRIKINENYCITSDERNFILNKVTVGNGEKNKGEIIEKPLSFSSTIQGALKIWSDLDLKASDATSLKELKEVILKQNKLIEEII